MLAKSQPKLDQFLAKQQLKMALKARSQFRKTDKLSKNHLETRAELDNQINTLREFIESNKCAIETKQRARPAKYED